MRRFLLGMVALVCAVLLTSCALVPFGLGVGDDQQADAQMEKIAAAVNSHDAGALEALFSKRALEKAAKIDAGLDYFLSLFPKGGLTWKRDGVGSEGATEHGKRTELLQANYTVSAGGKDYFLFFADFTVNDVYDPDNVGIYGLGVTPRTDDRNSGTTEPFSWWASSIEADESNAVGYPGVWVGFDNNQLALYKMDQIVVQLKFQDPVGLKDKFSEYARTGLATDIDNELDKLVALFADGDVVIEDQQAAPIVRTRTDNGGGTTLLLSTHRVSSGAVDYRLFLAYFPENATDPSKVGIYAIGVAPWTASGDSAAEQALSSWADTFDIDANVPPGILIDQ